MELLNFCNFNFNWIEKLAAKPYCIETKTDPPYFILKYNLIESNLNLDLCKESRGTILRLNPETNEWVCVCRSLDKFGNWGEDYADTKKIDWAAGVDVQEKIDGSIMRAWYDLGEWHLSTNNTIDAFKADCGDISFGKLFEKLVGNLNDFFQQLDPLYTYWFELVYPGYNTIVVHYKEPALYYLGRRNMQTMEEDCALPVIPGIKFPRHFHYNNLDEVLRACHEMGEDEEGYVCVATNQKHNGSYLRIKCKGDEYLKRHKLRGNGPLTTQHFISMWQEDTIDDFIAYFPEMRERVEKITHTISLLCEQADIAFQVIKGFEDRKEFALRAQTYIKPIQSFLFARQDNKCANATEWFKQFNAKKLANYLEVHNG